MTQPQNTIHELLSPYDKPQQSQLLVHNYPIYIYYAIFDSQNGPQFIYTNAPKENLSNSFSLFLFPSGWNENSTFAFYHDGWYCLAIGVSSPHISHSRGPLHSTIGLLSKGISFGHNHYDFLEEISKVFNDLHSTNNLNESQNFVQDFTNSFNFENIFHAISDQFEFSNQYDISHPLYSFTQRNSASKLFSDNPEMLLTLWRFRISKKRIVIACTKNISDATDLSYFIAALGLPCCNVDNGECRFLIDIADEEQYLNNSRVNENNEGWLVCSVTHPLMQTNLKGDVAITEDKKLVIHDPKSVKFLTKGGGNILKDIRNIIQNQKGDACLLQRMIDLTSGLLNISESCPIIDADVMKSIGLDKKNADFLDYWVQLNHCTAEVDIPTCGC